LYRSRINPASQSSGSGKTGNHSRKQPEVTTDRSASDCRKAAGSGAWSRPRLRELLENQISGSSKRFKHTGPARIAGLGEFLDSRLKLGRSNQSSRSIHAGA